MLFIFTHLCMIFLICVRFKASASSGCPDFNNIDACMHLKHVGRLRASFGPCDSIVTPHNARREPVVKYDDADKVCIVIVILVHG